MGQQPEHRWFAFGASGPCVVVQQQSASLRAQHDFGVCDEVQAKRVFWLFLIGAPFPNREQPGKDFFPPNFPSLKKAQNQKSLTKGCLATHGPVAAAQPPETSKRAVASPNVFPGVAW